MTFLASLAASLLTWFAQKALTLIGKLIEQAERMREIQARADAQAKAVQDAKTSEEFERAARDILGRR